MHLIAWASLATTMQQHLLSLEDCVVRVRNAKYEFVKKYQEHQIKLNEKTIFERVKDKTILDTFESHCVPETMIKKIGECAQWSRVNLKGYVKTCDDKPNGPSANASYWRNFEVSDASGNVVKGMAWGSLATDPWTLNVTVEMFNVSVRKADERIQLDDMSVIIFKNSYDLSLSMPAFFKPVVWSV